MQQDNTEDIQLSQYADRRFSYFKRLFQECEFGERTELRMCDEIGISDRSFQIFAENCHRFSKVQIIDFSGQLIKDQGLKKLGQKNHHIPNLKVLILRQNKINHGFKYFCNLSSPLPELAQMDFSYNQIQDSGLMALAQNGQKYPKLSWLEMSGNKLTDEGMIKFAENGFKFSEIKYISIGCNNIGDKGLRAMIENSDKFLKLANFSIQTKNIEQWRYKGIEAKFPSLRELYISSSNITDTKLKELVSTGLFKNLKVLSIAYNMVTDNGVKILTSNHYPLLQDLRMNMIEVSDVAYLHLIKNSGDMPKLARGCMSCCKKGLSLIDGQQSNWKKFIKEKLKIKNFLI